MDKKDFDQEIMKLLAPKDAMQLKDVKRTKDRIILVSANDEIYNCNLEKLNILIEKADQYILEADHRINFAKEEMQILFDRYKDEYFNAEPVSVYDIYIDNDEEPKYIMYYDENGNFVKQLNAKDGSIIMEASEDKLIDSNGYKFSQEGINIRQENYLFKNKEFEIYQFDDIIDTGFKLIDKDGNEFYFSKYGNEFGLCKCVYKYSKLFMNITIIINNITRSRILIEQTLISEDEERTDKIKYKYQDSPIFDDIFFEEKYLIVGGIGVFIYDSNFSLAARYLPRKELKLIK